MPPPAQRGARRAAGLAAQATRPGAGARPRCASSCARRPSRRRPGPQALEAEVAELREQSSGQDEGLAAGRRPRGGARTATAERDAAVTRAAELEPEVESLRDQIRAAGSTGRGPAGRRRRAAPPARRARAAPRRERRRDREDEPRAPRPAPARRAPVPARGDGDQRARAAERGRARPLRPLRDRLHPARAGRDRPEAGDIVEVDGARYVVRRHGPSPLPGPRRRCAYLERA